MSCLYTYSVLFHKQSTFEIIGTHKLHKIISVYSISFLHRTKLILYIFWSLPFLVLFPEKKFILLRSFNKLPKRVLQYLLQICYIFGKYTSFSNQEIPFSIGEDILTHKCHTLTMNGITLHSELRQWWQECSLTTFHGNVI